MIGTSGAATDTYGVKIDWTESNTIVAQDTFSFWSVAGYNNTGLVCAQIPVRASKAVIRVQSTFGIGTMDINGWGTSRATDRVRFSGNQLVTPGLYLGGVGEAFTANQDKVKRFGPTSGPINLALVNPSQSFSYNLAVAAAFFAGPGVAVQASAGTVAAGGLLLVPVLNVPYVASQLEVVNNFAGAATLTYALSGGQ